MAIDLKYLYDINNNNNINPEYSVHVNTVIVIAVMCNMNNNDTKWPLEKFQSSNILPTLINELHFFTTLNKIEHKWQKLFR